MWTVQQMRINWQTDYLELLSKNLLVNLQNWIAENIWFYSMFVYYFAVLLISAALNFFCLFNDRCMQTFYCQGKQKWFEIAGIRYMQGSM